MTKIPYFSGGLLHDYIGNVLGSIIIVKHLVEAGESFDAVKEVFEPGLPTYKKWLEDHHIHDAEVILRRSDVVQVRFNDNTRVPRFNRLKYADPEEVRRTLAELADNVESLLPKK